jgi:methyltransferase
VAQNQVDSSLGLLLALVVPFLLVETWWSRHNEARLRARGAVEPPSDVYRWMRPLYPGMFVVMAIEGALRGPAPRGWLAAGIATFLLSKALKWAAIMALGERWSFRVLVLPGVPLVTSGPYRFLRHPNYVAVLGEIAGAALMWRAWVSGIASSLVFGALLLRRIREEEEALGLGRRRS